MSTPKEQGPPYPPTTAAVGGVPTISVDVPICSVFLVLFICGAVSHMTILQINLKRGHKFIMSGMLFGFCMARIVTMIMRIVWANYPSDIQIAMAANIFSYAGVLILFLINVVFAQRILRAAHPHFGWHKTLSIIFTVLYVLIVGMLAMAITAIVQSFYTLNVNTHKIDRDMQITASTYLLFVSFLPIPMVVLGLIVPRKTRLEKFGTGRWRTKIAILLVSSVLLCLGACFRSATTYENPRPRDDPAWYHAKWCYYFFNFTLESIVIFLYVILRVDRRFHVPDGSKGPGDYVAEKRSREGGESTPHRGSASSMNRVLSKEEVFDDRLPVESKPSKDLEGQFGV